MGECVDTGQEHVMGTIITHGRQRLHTLQGRTRPLQVMVLMVATLSMVLLIPGVAHGAVKVSRAELSGGNLRIEGTAAPNRTITVDGAARGTSDGSGRFRIE